jgi:hypothetical protein
MEMELAVQELQDKVIQVEIQLLLMLIHIVVEVEVVQAQQVLQHLVQL